MSLRVQTIWPKVYEHHSNTYMSLLDIPKPWMQIWSKLPFAAITASPLLQWFFTNFWSLWEFMPFQEGLARK